MAWETKKVYVLTAFFKNFEESGYLEPSEEFYAIDWHEAQRMKKELMADDEYEDVIISDSPQKRELWESDKINEVLRRAKKIENDKIDDYQKDVKLAALMTELEQEFSIPILKDPEWEAKNPRVLEAYKAISDKRTL